MELDVFNRNIISGLILNVLYSWHSALLYREEIKQRQSHISDMHLSGKTNHKRSQTDSQLNSQNIKDESVLIIQELTLRY